MTETTPPWEDAHVLDGAHTEWNDAKIFGGPLDDGLLSKITEVAFGRNREDKHWKNIKGTLRQLLESITKFERGAKDGRCFLQGALVAPQRLADNVTACRLMMFDYDTGLALDDVAQRLAAHNLFSVIWTTHSHLKDETLVPEKKVLQWLRETGQLTGQAHVVTDQQVIDYLRQTAKIEPAILADAKVLGREHVEGGLKYRVKHAPMPRLRALFVLADDFDFATRPGSQKQAIDEWKELYGGVSVMLGLPFDRSCVDPSRLMYSPRISATSQIGPGHHDILIINGAPLDLSKVERVPLRTMFVQGGVATPSGGGVQDEISAFENVGADRDTSTQGGGRAEFKTANLRMFLGIAGHDFEAAEWMKSLDIEPRAKLEDGMDCACPNEDGHTAPDPTDRAFGVRNASGNRTTGGGFGMWCLHDGCKTLSNGDRGWYLDQICVAHGVTDALSLISPEWTPFVWEDRQKAQERQDKAQATVDAPGGLDALIGALTPQSKAADVQPVILALTKVAEGLERDDYILALMAKTGRKLAAVNKAIKQAEEATALAARSSVTGPQSQVPVATGPRHNVPEDLEEARWIWMDWGATTVKRAAAARLAVVNKKNPTLFQREEGGVVRIEHINGKARIAEMDSSMWTAETIGLTFMKTIETGEDLDISAPEWVLKHLQGMAEKPFPVLDRIVQVPVFGPDGTLHTARGYDHTLKVYLDPSCEIRPLPAVITPDHVNAAVDMLDEAIRDFPFSDTMDGSDPLPVKLDEVDGDGFPIPNMDRGVASRANCMAMILQPFIRNMIKGSTPGYHIDKAAAGTGAGYLVDVVAIIAEGRRAVASPLSENREEVKKVITSNLRSGAQIIFADNINHKVDSGPLAAALTSGTWSDRILGVSEVTTIPMKAMWIFAGNNVEFTHELMRRMVPIRLDAAVPRPAQDRGGKDFKHFPLQDWLSANRDALVHACHIIVAYWIQGGMLPGTGKMLSFDHYARVMSGILETAGITGFLDNVSGYLTSRDEEQSGIELFIQQIWKEYGEHGATSNELLELAKDPVTHAIGYGLPIGNDPREHVQVTLFGKYLSKLVGKTFNVEAKVAISGKTTPTKPTPSVGVILKMKLVKNTVDGRSNYRLLPLSSLRD